MTSTARAAPPAAALFRRLLDEGVLTTAEAVNEGVSFLDASVSHSGFHVWVGGAPRYFVKVADPVRSQGRDLHVEAAVYRYAASASELAGVLPACHFISADDTLIVLEAVPGAPVALGALRGEGDAPGSPPVAAASLLRRYAQSVARVHAVKPAPFGRPPWLLVALEPGSGGYAWLPEPCRELLLRLAGSASMRAAFRAARNLWVASSLVHGDLRWANVLASPAGAPPRLWLIDWELACRGDPGWDLASVIADVLATPDEAGRAAGLTPEAVHLTAAFLSAYREAARLSAGAWNDLLHRSLRFTSVRLVQTLVEYGHFGEAPMRAAEADLMPVAVDLLGRRSRFAAELSRAVAASSPP